MKFLLFASIFSFAVAAAVGSVDNGDVGIADQVDDNNLAIRDDKKIYNSNINYRAYKGTLSKDDCNDITKAFISVLQNKNYKGQPPSKTYKKYLAKNFVERSGSINSLISKNNDVSATILDTRDEWYEGVKQYPVKNIKASKIYVTDGNKCLWQWRFGSIGKGTYDIQGFNLLYISDKKEIAGVDIEFNSLAWGANTDEVKPFCPA